MKNTAIWVGNLPSSVSVQALADYFERTCGIILTDFATGERRVKLYPGDNNLSAKVIFLRPESVELALMLCQGDEPFDPQHALYISVAEPKEELVSREEANPKETAIDKATWKKRLERLQDRTSWQHDDLEDELALKRLLEWQCILLLRNVTPAYDDEALEDMRCECQRLVSGARVKASWLNEPASVVSVKFGSRDMAVHCLRMLNGRFYNGEPLAAAIYEGEPRLRLHARPTVEDERDDERRLEDFSEWIEQS